MGKRGYRIHYDKLPGKPDVVFTRQKKAIFMHGCFWHGDDCRAGRNTPNSNKDYWLPKLERNKERDKKHIERLREMKWRVIVIWECELKDIPEIENRINDFFCVNVC